MPIDFPDFLQVNAFKRQADIEQRAIAASQGKKVVQDATGQRQLPRD